MLLRLKNIMFKGGWEGLSYTWQH